jgi:microcystin-dependent protein
MTSQPSVPRRRFLGRALAAVTAGTWIGRVRLAEGAEMGTISYIGEIRMFAGNFAPAGWAFCNGQLLSIAENDALFSLIGTTYGGDGQVTFALPDLRSRAPVHFGTGQTGTTWTLGESAGTEEVTLTVNQIPAHTHAPGASGSGGSDSPAGGVPARNAAGVPQYGTTANASLAAGALLPVGGSQPHNNMQPYLGINFIISLFGIFPTPS